MKVYIVIHKRDESRNLFVSDIRAEAVSYCWQLNVDTQTNDYRVIEEDWVSIESVTSSER